LRVPLATYQVVYLWLDLLWYRHIYTLLFYQHWGVRKIRERRVKGGESDENLYTSNPMRSRYHFFSFVSTLSAPFSTALFKLINRIGSFFEGHRGDETSLGGMNALYTHSTCTVGPDKRKGAILQV
jgi:hypothetical protein